MFQKAAILGVGMIGASFGYALKQNGLAKQVTGFGRNAANLEDAVRVGAIDNYSTDLKEAVREADFVFVSVGLDAVAPLICSALPFMKKGAVVTDGGSTKETIVEKVLEALPEGIHFIGGHPIAGSEKQGATNLIPNLYEGAVTILTPHTKSKGERFAAGVASLVWKKIGAKLEFMDVREHDRLLALISHLPHAVAYALVNCIENLPQSRIDIAAGGFRDFTRIAASDAELWTGISFANKTALHECLLNFEEEIRTLRVALETNDRAKFLEKLTTSSTIRKERFPERKKEKKEYLPVIAIDGPAGAGKSTIAKMIAERLGITYLDTGAIYRSLALACRNSGVSLSDVPKVLDVLKTLDLTFHFEQGNNRVSLNGTDVSVAIREPEISALSSEVSRIPAVREGLLEFQRAFAMKGMLVCDGRDTGSVVFPKALYKFYLDADLNIRGKRRFDELKEKAPALDTVTAEMAKRDHEDTNRPVAPLTIPSDAIYFDTTEHSVEEVFDFVVKYLTPRQ